jgi:hypothetical protein
MRTVPPEAHSIEIDTVCDDGACHVTACDKDGGFLELIQSFDNGDEAWAFAENLARSKNLPLFHRDDPFGHAKDCRPLPKRQSGQDMNEKQLEDTVIHLINRREMTKKGSPDWEAACEAIGRFIDQYPEAGHIADDYNSILNPFAD